MGSRAQASTARLPCGRSPRGQQGWGGDKDHTMTWGVGSRCQPGAVPRADIGTVRSGDPPVPAPKPSPSPCQALLTGETQAAGAGAAKTGRKA